MTISNTTREVIYTGNGATTVWAYAFPIPSADAANVTLEEIATGVQTVISANDYTITGIGSESGGSVTYPTVASGDPAIESTHKLIIFRTVPVVQGVSVNNQTNYDAGVVEGVWDRLTMMIQDLDGESTNHLTYPIGDDSSPVVPDLESRKNQFWLWDANGEPDVAAGITGVPVSSWAENWLGFTNTDQGRNYLDLGTGDMPTFAGLTTTSQFTLSDTFCVIINSAVANLEAEIGLSIAGSLILNGDRNGVGLATTAGVILRSNSTDLLDLSRNGLVTGASLASTAEAQAGTVEKLMTAAKTKSAITAQVPGLIPAQTVTGGANVGSGTGGNSFKDLFSGNLRFRKLLQGSNMTITEQANTVTFASTAAGSGTEFVIGVTLSLTAGGPFFRVIEDALPDYPACTFFGLNLRNLQVNLSSTQVWLRLGTNVATSYITGYQAGTSYNGGATLYDTTGFKFAGTVPISVGIYGTVIFRQLAGVDEWGVSGSFVDTNGNGYLMGGYVDPPSTTQGIGFETQGSSNWFTAGDFTPFWMLA